MKVGFDAERLRNPNSGLGQFCIALGEALIRTQPAQAALRFVVPADRMNAFGGGVEHTPAAWWQRYRAPGDADVWHATHQDTWIKPPGSARTVLTIMDLNFLEREDYSAARKQRRLAAVQRKVDHAVALSTISAYTADVVRQHLEVPDIPLRVIHLGNPLERAPAAARPESPLLSGLEPGRFFLFVGVIHPKKNVISLVPLLRAFPGMSLVLAGQHGHPYAAEVASAATAANLADRVLMPGGVPDSAKRWLYENCRALLFPSIAEGFGLPVVEAMSAGKPAFISRLTSLPEIGGAAASYFDSFDAESMIGTIRSGLADYDANPRRAAQLRDHAARYSWTRAATEYWELYAEARRSPRR